MKTQVARSDIVALMPCRNEAPYLPASLRSLKDEDISTVVVSIDPATTDESAAVAMDHGASVIHAEASGYDQPMYDATQYALSNFPGRPLLYVDAGNKFSFDMLDTMIGLLNKGAYMVLGNRVDTVSALRWHQKTGTQLVLRILNMLHGTRFVDISPFRLVRAELFDHVKMQPKQFRWTTEMLSKTLACKLPIAEVDIRSRTRIGESKISGSIINSIKAGGAMLSGLQFVRYKGEKKYEHSKKD